MDERTVAGLNLHACINTIYTLKARGESADTGYLRELQKKLASEVTIPGEIVVVSRSAFSALNRADFFGGTVILCRSFFIRCQEDGSTVVTDDENNRLSEAALPDFIREFCWPVTQLLAD